MFRAQLLYKTYELGRLEEVSSRVPKLIKELCGQDRLNIHLCRYWIPIKYSKSKGVKYMVFIQNKRYAWLYIFYTYYLFAYALYVCEYREEHTVWKAETLIEVHRNWSFGKKWWHGLSLCNQIPRHRIFVRRNCGEQWMVELHSWLEPLNPKPWEIQSRT